MTALDREFGEKFLLSLEDGFKTARWRGWDIKDSIFHVMSNQYGVSREEFDLKYRLAPVDYLEQLLSEI